MSHEFTVDEIRDTAMTARVHCPGFTEDMFESLMELEKRIADSGYLEVIQGMLRLEEEKGVSCAEALDACKDLLEQKTKLEREVPALEKRVESLVEQRKQASAEYEQLKNATAKVEQELAQIESQCAAAEKKLGALNKKIEKERQRTDREIEEYHRQANITKEEVITAGGIKAGVESHGFTLELMLGLSKEFADHKNAFNWARLDTFLMCWAFPLSAILVPKFKPGRSSFRFSRPSSAAIVHVPVLTSYT